MILSLLIAAAFTGQPTPAAEPAAPAAPSGMVWIPGGEFVMGCDNDTAWPAEKPIHRVRVSGFFMDATEVTNAQFRAFIKATGYVTTAEKKPDWEELKKQVPPNTPKPSDDKLVAASIVFTPPSTQPADMQTIDRWWTWTPGADWKHPQGPASNLDGKDDYPVVHVSWDDAIEYCKWAGKQLPTEAQWEFAARGGLDHATFVWGNEPYSETKPQCNAWQGVFPSKNTNADGYERSCPVRAFPANGYGLYGMAGNVWEWCADWYRADAYKKTADAAAAAGAPGRVEIDPKGPSDSWDPEQPFMPERVIRGGSFLCHPSYCASYRPSARRGNSPDTSIEHQGFRCVVSKEAWEEKQKSRKP